MAQKQIPKNGYAFTEAYNQLNRKEQQLLRKELMQKLNIKRCSLYNRIKGVIPTHPEFIIIKEAFKRFGIIKVFAYEKETD